MKSTEKYINERKRSTQSIISVYCRKRHGGDGLCEECREICDYALSRIEECGNNASRTRCKGCPTRCYDRDMGRRMSEILDDRRLTIVLHPIRYRRIFLRGHSIGRVSLPHLRHILREVAIAQPGQTLSVRSSSSMLDIALSDSSSMRASSSRLFETMTARYPGCI